MDWRIKVGTQFVLARCPGGRRVNHALQRGRRSHTPEVVGRRVAVAVTGCAWMQACGVQFHDRGVLEIGTGWDALNPLLLHLLGARRIHTYDVTRLLQQPLVRLALDALADAAPSLAAAAGVDVETMRRRIRFLQSAPSLDILLERAGIRYHAPADASRTDLRDACIDLVYSREVLEHVPIAVMQALNREAKRVLRPQGAVYHATDHSDHYATFDRSISRVHFLQRSDRWWDFFVQNDLAYHNRLREPELCDVFRRDGLEIIARRTEIDRAALAVLPRMRLDARFRRFTPEELAVTRSEIMLRPRK